MNIINLEKKIESVLEKRKEAAEIYWEYDKEYKRLSSQLRKEEEEILQFEVGQVIHIKNESKHTNGSYYFPHPCEIEIDKITDKFITSYIKPGETFFKKVKGRWKQPESKEIRMSKKHFMNLVLNRTDLKKVVEREKSLIDLGIT